MGRVYAKNVKSGSVHQRVIRFAKFIACMYIDANVPIGNRKAYGQPVHKEPREVLYRQWVRVPSSSKEAGLTSTEPVECHHSFASSHCRYPVCLHESPDPH